MQNKPTKLIFFDTETTGNTDEDFLCQLAYKINEETFTGLYKPPKRIPPEASAVHHITNKMLENAIAFKENPDYKKIKELFEDENSVVVAHNALFDLAMMHKEDINPKNFICTLRVARDLDREGKIERYNLQYLRYLLEIEVEAVAHDALGDVLVLEKLFERLMKKIKDEDNASDEDTIKKMIDISSRPSILRTFSFGKHNGKTIAEVCATDRGYLEWLLAQKLESEQNEDDWIYTLNHHLKK